MIAKWIPLEELQVGDEILFLAYAGRPRNHGIVKCLSEVRRLSVAQTEREVTIGDYKYFVSNTDEILLIHRHE